MKNTSSTHRFIIIAFYSFIIFSVSIFSAYSQQMPKMNADSAKVNSKNVSDKGSQMSDEKEIAHVEDAEVHLHPQSAVLTMNKPIDVEELQTQLSKSAHYTIKEVVLK